MNEANEVVETEAAETHSASVNYEEFAHPRLVASVPHELADLLDEGE